MSVELLKNPISYAKRAIEVLEDQLQTSISRYRKIKLNSKITEWKKFLELMQSDSNDSENKETTEATQS